MLFSLSLSLAEDEIADLVTRPVLPWKASLGRKSTVRQLL